MRVMRFNARSLVGAIAALGIAAMLAGPAVAGGGSSGRTGHINKDCSGFSLQTDGDKCLFKASCRTNDDNEDKKATSIDIAANIGNYGGNLTWNYSRFHKSCGQISLDDLSVKAYCPYSVCPRNTGGECQTRWKWSWFNLTTKYKVNSSGDLALK